ncbi:MAG: methyltransferase domain-containing protein [Defluviitaleaceae bacterium]|nr:methyltransferase domain-containing protein [Defluviitaleaceae bacterium]
MALENYYNSYNEDGRLASRHGQVEFLTTMRYIERYLTPGVKVLEIGAGSGRYSRAIADLGYDVAAVELVESNIEVFKSRLKPEQRISVAQGNALDLSMFADACFDMTLVLGPMYHMYTEDDKALVISEALRVTKPGGVLFVAYCHSDASIVHSGFALKSFDVLDYMERGKINPDTFETFSEPADIFELIRKEDIDRLMSRFDVERLHYIATDLFSRYIMDALKEMINEEYGLYLRYHFAVCERADMVGITHHSLDVFRKN